jgi:hypothetical protein
MFIAIAISTIAVTIAVYGIALWLDPPPAPMNGCGMRGDPIEAFKPKLSAEDSASGMQDIGKKVARCAGQ